MERSWVTKHYHVNWTTRENVSIFYSPKIDFLSLEDAKLFLKNNNVVEEQNPIIVEVSIQTYIKEYKP